MEQGFYNNEGLDLLKEIDKDSIDLVITDPPYLISRDSGMNRLYKKIENSKDEEELEEVLSKEKYREKFGIKTQYGKWDETFTISELKKFIEEYYRVLKKGGTCIIFFDLWKIQDLKNIAEECKFKKIRFIEWIKTNPPPINSKISYLSNAREVAIVFSKGSGGVFNSKHDDGIYEYPIYQGKPNIDRIHPTQKPLCLFEELIQKHTDEDQWVLDTFAGSATTYIGAMNTSRNCISCEADEKYYTKAVKRIEFHIEKIQKRLKAKEVDTENLMKSYRTDAQNLEVEIGALKDKTLKVIIEKRTKFMERF